MANETDTSVQDGVTGASDRGLGDFTEHRDLMFTVGYEITGSVSDAEDVVQESYLRWAELDEADRGQIRGALLDGPLAFDNAISAQSAQNKGIASDVAGRPDVLLVPSLEAGNMVYKQLVYLAGAECAGLVLGMRVPIVLTSRCDSVASRIASCALAVLMSERRAAERAA